MQLEEWRDQIVDLFPGQNPHNYYYPFKSIRGRGINPGGCLFDHYQYMRRDLAKKGLVNVLPRRISGNNITEIRELNRELKYVLIMFFNVLSPL